MRSEISSSIIICGLVLLASCSSTSFVVIWFSLSCRFHLIWLDNTLREVSLFVIALASGILIVSSAVLYFFVRSGTFLNILGFDILGKVKNKMFWQRKMAKLYLPGCNNEINEPLRWVPNGTQTKLIRYLAQDWRLVCCSGLRTRLESESWLGASISRKFQFLKEVLTLSERVLGSLLSRSLFFIFDPYSLLIQINHCV